MAKRPAPARVDVIRVIVQRESHDGLIAEKSECAYPVTPETHDELTARAFWTAARMIFSPAGDDNDLFIANVILAASKDQLLHGTISPDLVALAREIVYPPDKSVPE